MSRVAKVDRRVTNSFDGLYVWMFEWLFVCTYVCIHERVGNSSHLVHFKSNLFLPSIVLSLLYITSLYFMLFITIDIDINSIS